MHEPKRRKAAPAHELAPPSAVAPSSMPIRELKQALTARAVDWSGCVEKRELVELLEKSVGGSAGGAKSVGGSAGGAAVPMPPGVASAAGSGSAEHWGFLAPAPPPPPLNPNKKDINWGSRPRPHAGSSQGHHHNVSRPVT
jgi:hypothetical protein